VIVCWVAGRWRDGGGKIFGGRVTRTDRMS